MRDEFDLSLLKIATYRELVSTRRIFAYPYEINVNFPYAGALYISGPEDKNPKMVLNPSLMKTQKDAIFVIAHEVLHDMLEHLPRMINFLGRKYNDEQFSRWGIATDHIINYMLKSLDFSCDIMKNAVDLSPIYGDIVNDMGAEELYRFLEENTEQQTIVQYINVGGKGNELKQNQSSNNGKGESDSSDGQENENSSEDNNCGSNNEGSDDKNEQGENQGGSDPGKIKVVTTKLVDKKTGKTIIEEHKLVAPSPDQISKSDTIKADGAFELEAIFGAGKLPGNIKKELDMIKCPLNLRGHLENYLSTIKQGSDDITFLQYSLLNLVLDTELVIPKIISRTVNCIIGVDTSGSILDDNYSEFIGIIYKNLEWLNCKIYFCDAEIQAEYDLRDLEYEDAISVFKKLKTRPGYGGTRFDPVFKKAESELDLDLIIYFTDLEPFNWPKPPRCKTLWIARKTYQNVKPPFGKVVYY